MRSTLASLAALAVPLCLCSSRLRAQDATVTRWFTIDSTPTIRVRLNLDRLRRESPTVIEAWTELSFAADQKPYVEEWGKWRRRVDDVYIDCDRLHLMHLTYSLYRANGERAGTYTPTESKRVWDPAEPGSLDELVAKRACDIMQKP